MKDQRTFLLRVALAVCALCVVLPGTVRADLVGVGCTTPHARNCALSSPTHGTALSPGNTIYVAGSQEIDNAYSSTRVGHSASCSASVLLGTDPSSQYSFSLGTINGTLNPNVLGPSVTNPPQWYRCSFSGNVTMPDIASLPASLQTAIQSGTQVYLIAYPMLNDLTTGETHMMNVGSYGEHVTINAPPVNQTLTVTKNIAAGGSVTSNPAGINCGTACSSTSYNYAQNTTVTLTASAASGYTFTGWSGACSGASCTVSMNAAKTATANFTATAQAAIGTFESVNSTACTVTGWAFDPDASAQSISVHVYRDQSAFAGGTYLTQCVANTYRSDVNAAYGISGNHGFTCALPASYQGTGSHNLYIHAIDTTGSPNNVISSSPKSLSCAVACTETSWSPDPSTVCSGQSFTQTGSPCGTTRSAVGTMSCVPPSTPTVTAARYCSGTTPYVYLSYWVSDATSYNIRYCTGTSCSPSTVIPSADPWGYGDYSHTGVTVGTTYGYQVQAVNAYGSSAWSSPTQYVSVTVCPPTAPSLTATAQCGGSDPQVALSYSATGATTYTGQYCNTSSSCTPSTALFSGVANTSYTHAPLTAGKVYRYRVNATNAGGTSAWSTVRSATASSTCAPTTYALTVVPAGEAISTGSVSSAPTGITCGTDCTETYTSGTNVALNAASTDPNAQATYSGGCTGTGSCSLAMDSSKTVTATFACKSGFEWNSSTNSCVALNYCGSANNGTFRTAPTANLCVSGASSTWVDQVGSDGTFNWTCTGAKGATSCSAMKNTGGAR